MDMQTVIPFLWLAASVFVVTAIVQMVFPVDVYQKVRESNLSAANKGRFAYTVESLYQVKTKGFDADGKYWWHLTWFNTAVSISVSAIVLFWTLVIIAIVVVALGFILLSIIAGSR